MSEIDPITGLPKELSVFEEIAKESVKIVATEDKRKFGKIYTVVEGLEQKGIDIKDITKKLKHLFACGGTLKGGIIELQGSHIEKIKEALVELGFAEETIEIKQSKKRKNNQRR